MGVARRGCRPAPVLPSDSENPDMKRFSSPFALVAALAALPAAAAVKYWDNPAFKAYDVGDYV